VAWVQAVIDTLQTLPSFVYLMPVVMLFRVGDFTAMIAVVAYAVAPAIRYTAHGPACRSIRADRGGPGHGLHDRWQLLTKIKLKLALPEIMLGLNQTIMFALSMLVITALVGTRDLGQEVYIALTKADTGRGSSRAGGRLHRHHRRPADLGRRPAAKAKGWGCERIEDRIAALPCWRGGIGSSRCRAGSPTRASVTDGTAAMSCASAATIRSTTSSRARG
jgi:hypothetical protein